MRAAISGFRSTLLLQAIAVLTLTTLLQWIGEGNATAASCYDPFVVMREKLGTLIVGDCIDNPVLDTDPTYGGRAISQQTTRGQFIWRSADNLVAFSNQTTTWVDGPNGIEQRPNGERFVWEADGSAVAAAEAARAAQEAAEQAHRATSLEPFVGDWWQHGFTLSIGPDGRASAGWRTFIWCAPGITGPCDRMENDLIIYGGRADIEFYPPGLGQNYSVGSVRTTNNPAVLNLGALTLRLQQYGTATLEQDGRVRATLCGPRYLTEAPEWFKRTLPCGA